MIRTRACRTRPGGRRGVRVQGLASGRGQLEAEAAGDGRVLQSDGGSGGGRHEGGGGGQQGFGW